MRARVYRNFTFKSYETETNEKVFQSDNFFTVESNLTAILKSRMENNEDTMDYTIYQESKDGKSKRAIERVYTLPNDDTVHIDMVIETVEE